MSRSMLEEKFSKVQADMYALFTFKYKYYDELMHLTKRCAFKNKYFWLAANVQRKKIYHLLN